MSATAAVILTHTKVVRPIVACDARGTTKSSFSRASQFRRGRSYMRAHARLRCLFISPHGVSLFLASPIAPSWPVHARHLPGVKVNRRHPSLGPPRREDGFSSAARKEARRTRRGRLFRSDPTSNRTSVRANDGVVQRPRALLSRLPRV